MKSQRDSAAGPVDVGLVFAGRRVEDGALEVRVVSAYRRSLPIKWLALSVAWVVLLPSTVLIDRQLPHGLWIGLAITWMLLLFYAAFRSKFDEPRWIARTGRLVFTQRGLFRERRREYLEGTLIYKRLKGTDSLLIRSADGRRKAPWAFHLFWIHLANGHFMHDLAIALAKETGFPLVEEPALAEQARPPAPRE